MIRTATVLAIFITFICMSSVMSVKDQDLSNYLFTPNPSKQEIYYDDDQGNLPENITHGYQKYTELLIDDNDCPVDLSIYYEKIDYIQSVIMKTLVQMNTTLISLKETEERQNLVLIEMCMLEILSNRFDKALKIFDLICDELAISKIIGQLYIYDDFESFEQIIYFINLLKIEYTKINGLTELYKLLIVNKDLNIVNGIMLLNGFYSICRDDCKYMEKVLTKQILHFIEQKEIALFFTFARKFDKIQLINDMMPTLVPLLYGKDCENIPYVLDLLKSFHYLDHKVNMLISLMKEVTKHKHSDENNALTVAYHIIHYKTIIANHKLLEKHGNFLKMIENSLPNNYLPLLYTDLCIMNKRYGRYLFIDINDHVQLDKYRPILTRKTTNLSLMYVGSMKFGISFKCVQENCNTGSNTVVIESMMNEQVERLFAANGTVHTYKGLFPTEMDMQGTWLLESDGDYFQFKNRQLGAYLQMEEITGENIYELNLSDSNANWNSDKTKWKIEQCKHRLNV